MAKSAYRSPPLLVTTSVLALVLVVFARTLGGGFLGDDFVYVARFAELPWSSWPALFTREWSDGIWGFALKELRPFAALSLMIESRVFGGSAFGYRMANLVFFSLSTVLVIRLAWRYSNGGALAALAAGTLFVLSPIQVEPVAWITGRVDLLAALAALGFWHFAERHCDDGRWQDLVFALVALFVGVFSKEFCLVAPPLLAASWLLIPRAIHIPWRRRLAVAAGAALIIAVYALARHSAFGSDAATPISSWHDDAAWKRQVSYFGWIFPSLPFFHRHEFAAVPAIAQLKVAAALIGAMALTGAVWLRVKKCSPTAPVAFFGGVWWVATILSLLVVPYFSPRHLHFGSMGLAIAAGLALGLVQIRSLRVVLLLGFAGWFATAQHRAIVDWHEAGQISRSLVTQLDRASEILPGHTVVLISAPANWRTAWLFSWSAPHLAGKPFTRRADGRELVGAPPPVLFQPDAWNRIVGERLPPALAEAPAALLLQVDGRGAVQQRVFSGDNLEAARATLASLARDGMNEGVWHTWIQSLTAP